MAQRTKLSPQTLPTEIWARVFRFLGEDEDVLDLWTGCRPLCKSFKKEVEFLFSENHLQRTWIEFDLGPYRIDDGEDGEDDEVLISSRFEFVRLSEDHSTAYFQSDLAVDVAPEYEHRTIFIDRLRRYVEDIEKEEIILNPKHTVQIRRMVNDTAIPKLSVNYDTLELSCDWRSMLSMLLYEESKINDLQSEFTSGKNAVGLKMKGKIERGELTTEEAIVWALKFFGTQHDESVKLARHSRIDRQIKRCYKGSDDTVDLDSVKRRYEVPPGSTEEDWYQLDHSNMERLKTLRNFIELEGDSDDETEEGEDGNDEDDEWEDEDEDEDGEEDEEELGGETSV